MSTRKTTTKQKPEELKVTTEDIKPVVEQPEDGLLNLDNIEETVPKADYDDMVQQFTKSIEVLKSTNANLAKKIEELSVACASNETQTEYWNSEFSRVASEVEQARGELDDCNKEKDEANAQVELLRDEIAKKELEVEKLRMEKDQVEQSLKEYRDFAKKSADNSVVYRAALIALAKEIN